MCANANVILNGTRYVQQHRDPQQKDAVPAYRLQHRSECGQPHRPLRLTSSRSQSKPGPKECRPRPKCGCLSPCQSPDGPGEAPAPH
eukprot:1748493-Pyramimonas_sp.AAC.1